eukprot:m.75895 g.75895  ORF g.75895 m.75895 type:complete len:443 (+) comp24836_c1_seq2:320-1648(+)
MTNMASNDSLLRLGATSFALGCAFGGGLSTVRMLYAMGKKPSLRSMKSRSNLKQSNEDDEAAIRNKLRTVLRLMLTCGVAGSGGMLTQAILYRAFMKWQSLRPAALALSTGIAAFWAAAVPSGSIREGGCLIVLSRAMMVCGKYFVAKGNIPFAKRHATFVFTLSCFEIMKAWFYHPVTLPREYIKWITSMAQIDFRLINALRLVRNGEVTIGQKYNGDFLESYVEDRGLDRKIGDPVEGRMCCSGWHAPHTCAENLFIRAKNAAKVTIPLYSFVHLLPRLLLPRTLLKNPAQTLLSVAKNVLRSSAFLTSFIVSIWFGVCGMRRLRDIALVVTKEKAETLDKWFDPKETWGPLVGCVLCGLAIELEAPSRRPVLALYVCSRALASFYQRQRISFRFPVIKHGDVLTMSVAAAILSAASQHYPRLSDKWLNKQMHTVMKLLR